MGSIDEGWALIIAAWIAILGILYSSREGRKALRKQHTYSVLDKMSDWQKFDDSYDRARALMNAGQVPTRCNDDHREACDTLDFLLNHYEFLSAAIVSGDLDESLVRRIEEGRLVRLFLKLIGYVEEDRERMSDRGTWENMEYMCYRWTLETRDSYDRMLDRFLQRPNTVYFHTCRDIVWKALRERAALEP